MIGDGLVWRTARKPWKCAGDGAIPPHHSPECTGTIVKGQRYVECFYEAPIFGSGTRHCVKCAIEFFQDVRDETDAEKP
ncbi:MAG: hypothetical protein C5B60_05575 [Chloroflexi bacterium]|nr:MAG: hypothetical protein C5B60_05575 [Chloroflexota bacterium]